MDVSSEGSFSVWEIEDFAESEAALITILSDLRPIYNSRRVLAVDGVSRMS